MDSAGGILPRLAEQRALLSALDSDSQEETSGHPDNNSFLSEGSTSGVSMEALPLSTQNREELPIHTRTSESPDTSFAEESGSGYATGLPLSADNDTTYSNLEKQKLDRLLQSLYGSHFLSRWGDRMWEFAVGLFMIHVWPDSLLLVAVYGLVEAASVAAFGVLVGELVDKCPRLKVLGLASALAAGVFTVKRFRGSSTLLLQFYEKVLTGLAFGWEQIQVVRVSLAIQNGSVVAATLAVVLLLLHPGSTHGAFGVFILLVIFVNVFGAIGALAGLAMDVVVERDWVVSIATKQAPGVLTGINAVMRRIDLSCKLLAPVAVGFLMSYVSVLASAILISVWNVTSVGVEYWLLHRVYMQLPILHCKSPCKGTQPEISHRKTMEELSEVPEVEMGILAEYKHGGIEVEDYHNEDVSLLQRNNVETNSGTVALVKKLKNLPIIEGWGTYMHQEALLAGLALSLLYFTVLSFGSYMTAVLNWRGVPPYVLGLARGVAAMVGILATVIYPVVHTRLQTVRTGIWSIWIQCSLLLVCVASIWVRSSRVASIMLISGVAASRLGLWMFDLSVTQLMQESVPEAERGVVGGVQKSLQSLMDMLTYVVGMVIVHPQDFGILIGLSYIAVLTAAVLYSVHVYRVRGHLFHFDRLLRTS